MNDVLRKQYEKRKIKYNNVKNDEQNVKGKIMQIISRQRQSDLFKFAATYKFLSDTINDITSVTNKFITIVQLNQDEIKNVEIRNLKEINNINRRRIYETINTAVYMKKYITHSSINRNAMCQFEIRKYKEWIDTVKQYAKNLNTVDDIDQQFLTNDKICNLQFKDESIKDIIDVFEFNILKYDQIAFSNSLLVNITDMINAIRNNPIVQEYNNVARYIVKQAVVNITETYKENGLIYLYTMENLFGYRSENNNKEFYRKEIIDWFVTENEHGREQVAAWKKGLSLLMKSNTQIARQFRETINKNVNRLNTRMSPLTIYNADGVSANIKVPVAQLVRKVVNNKKRRRILHKIRKVTKTNLFSMMDEHKFMQIYDSGVVPPEFNSASVVRIKREPYKLRPIISTDLTSFIYFTEIDYLIKKLFNGFNGPYTTQNKLQKGSLVKEYYPYLQYNLDVQKRFIMLPLDYSHYDHSFSKELMLTAMYDLIMMIKNVDLKEYYLKLYDNITKYFENIKVDFFGEILNYNKGLLSGWKITNSLESIVNFVIIFGQLSEFSIDSIRLINTMGDDLVVILDSQKLRVKMEPKQVLQRLSKMYSSLGIEIHPVKNSASYTFIEFLRVAYYGKYNAAYPIRIM